MLSEGHCAFGTSFVFLKPQRFPGSPPKLFSRLTLDKLFQVLAPLSSLSFVLVVFFGSRPGIFSPRDCLPSFISLVKKVPAIYTLTFLILFRAVLRPPHLSWKSVVYALVVPVHYMPKSFLEFTVSPYYSCQNSAFRARTIPGGLHPFCVCSNTLELRSPPAFLGLFHACEYPSV